MNLKMSITLLLMLLFTLNANAQINKDLEGLVTNKCDSLIEQGILNSIYIAIIHKGKSHTFDIGKLLDGRRPTDTTLYEIASLTKTFTGLLLAHAVSENKLKIDDDIRKYLKGGFENLEYKGHPITFRHLLTHTSGLPIMFPHKPEMFENANWDELPFNINALQAGYTKDDFIKELRKVQLDTVPGHKFAYSNAGANVIALILEDIYHESYEKLLKKKILDPLKMSHTSAGKNKDIEDRLVKGTNANDISMPSRANKYFMAEGGIVSNVDDMIKYMRHQLNEENPVINISHQELYGGKYGDFENGFLWQIFKNGEGPRKIYQNGGAFGTSSWMTLIPELDIGVFLITDIAGPDVHQQLSSLSDFIVDQLENSK